MDTLNSNQEATESAPVATPTPAAIVPEVAVAPAPAAAPAPVTPVNMELPKTTAKTPGGWNRFAGFNPNAAKNKPKDRRDGAKRGR